MPKEVPVDPGGQNVASKTTKILTRSQKRALEEQPNLNDQGLHPPRPKSPYPNQPVPDAQVPGSSNGSSLLQPGISVVVSNEYDLLDDEEVGDNDDEMPVLTPSLTKTTPAAKAKKVRVPPISVFKQTTRQLRELMTKCDIAQTEYHMKATKTGVQLLCTGEKSFRSTVDALKKLDIEFHTYTPASEQPVKVILSGLPVFDVTELETELLLLGVNATEVKLFSRKVVGLEESALYLLHFAKGTVKLSELQKIRAVLNIIVKWRYFERKYTDAVQCHRCQRFGHGMRNCNLPPLCVKCGEKHLSAECSLPKKAELERVDKNETRGSIRCANCSGQHTANYRGCPSRKSYIEKLAKIRAERRHPAPPPLLLRPFQNQTSSSPTDAAANSYAQVLSNQVSSTNDLFTMTKFLALAREMFGRLANCRSKQDQLLALFELSTKYLYKA